ncbi:MAG: hypothetical protein RMI91_02730 [Gemmatales bacterium]|nr:hypothetical protein [Gemmatales bacterium]MDW7993543.1 hypothetical protein [Gemmatales bacterium]
MVAYYEIFLARELAYFLRQHMAYRKQHLEHVFSLRRFSEVKKFALLPFSGKFVKVPIFCRTMEEVSPDGLLWAPLRRSWTGSGTRKSGRFDRSRLVRSALLELLERILVLSDTSKCNSCGP